jgi:hypothetical protein
MTRDITDCMKPNKDEDSMHKLAVREVGYGEWKWTEVMRE